MQITVEVGERTLKALSVPEAKFRTYWAEPVEHTKGEIMNQQPCTVIAIVAMEDGTYRLGGEFLGQYIDRQVADGQQIVSRMGPVAGRQPVDLTPENFDAVARNDPYNGGENNIN